MRLQFSSWLATLVSAVLVTSACHHPSADSTAASPETAPNFILVVVDALRRDHLGMYGYDKPTTPGMDSIAAEGIIFDNAYSHGSQTFNSTASLLTSRYFPYLLPRPGSEPIAELNTEAAARHSRVPVLAASNITLAEALHDAGYQTLGVFTNPHHHSSSGFWQGFEVARYLQPGKGDVAYARGPRIHEAFFDWYDQERDTRPYFAYLHFMDVHNPYRPPRFLRKQFVTVKGRDLYRKGIPAPDRVPTENDLRYMIGLYDAEIRFVDLVIENLMRDLAKRGGSENTILIVTSDHGDEFMDHGGLGHGAHLERELIHVPLLVSGLPSQVRRQAALVRHIDLAPTLVELAGSLSPAGFEGVSLAPLFHDQDPVSLGITESFAAVGRLRSLTTDQWHFTFNERNGETRLYRLASDPGGHQDLSREHPAVVEAFLSELEELDNLKALTAREALELAGDLPLYPDNAIDSEIRKQLEALGYVEN